MAEVTLESVLAQARLLPLEEQARLTRMLERERALRLVAILDEWAAGGRFAFAPFVLQSARRQVKSPTHAVIGSLHPRSPVGCMLR